MTPEERWAKIEEVFQAAIEMPPSARSTFIKEKCGEDSDLLVETEKLIAQFEADSGFLESPIWDDSLFLRTTLKDKIASSLKEEIATTERDNSPIGQIVGAYRLMEEIGRGGMGVVYLAARTEDFNQKVALKIVKRGMDSDFILRRFRQERQVLASLDHPNIARLLDGGTTEDGRPFLVMEYIEGTTIDHYCDEQKLPITERLKIFRQICEAIEYLHQRLIIHRDIKPSNILVTAEGVPKLLDFGIAKLLDQAMLSTSYQPTAPAARLLTPDYASPEQLRGESLTTVSDVYSLGVLLYYLLTGNLPFHFREGTPDAFAQIVSERKPARPSHIVTASHRTTLEDGDRRTNNKSLSAIADNRRTQPKRLIRYLADDLDNIVLKALRKEPVRRYSSVEQFSEDLRRHLEGLPVKARGDDFAYRLRKFINRHRASVLAGGLLILTLLGGIVATSRQAKIAERERNRAEAESARANRRFAESRRLSESLMFELHDAIRDLPGATVARELLAKRTLEQLDQLALDAEHDMELKSELAIAYINLGNIQGNPYYSNLGNPGAALESYRKAEKLTAELSTADPQNVRLQRRYWLTQLRIGDILSAQGHLTEAKAIYARALSLIENLSAANIENESLRADVASSLDRQGNALMKTNDYRAALVSFGKAQEIFESSTKSHPDDDALLRAVGAGFGKIGTGHLKLGEYAKALESYNRLLAINETRAAKNPGNAQMRDDAASSRRELADAQTKLTKFSEARSNYRHAISVYKELTQADPANVKFSIELAVSYQRLGNLEMQTGEFASALKNHHDALRILNDLKSKNPGNSAVGQQLAAEYYYLGEASFALAQQSQGSGRDKLLSESQFFFGQSVKEYQRHPDVPLPDGVSQLSEIENKIKRSNTVRK